MLLKSLFDHIVAFLGLLFLSPILLVTAILIRVKMPGGPVIFKQKRVGQYGRLFTMYKFRSMVIGADEKLKKYLEENEEARLEYKKYKKMKEDPRVTKIGKFIRKTSLDEFPQFINVLKGDMSLVGPRPYLEREKEDMTYFYKYIVSCKPGVTGLWQVSGRSDVTFEDRMRMDMEYFRRNGLRVDVKILKKTVEKLLRKEGAV